MSGGRARGHLGEWRIRVEGQLKKTEPGSLLNQAAAACMVDGPVRRAAKRRPFPDWNTDTATTPLARSHESTVSSFVPSVLAQTTEYLFLWWMVE